MSVPGAQASLPGEHRPCCVHLRCSDRRKDMASPGQGTDHHCVGSGTTGAGAGNLDPVPLMESVRLESLPLSTLRASPEEPRRGSWEFFLIDQQVLALPGTQSPAEPGEHTPLPPGPCTLMSGGPAPGGPRSGVSWAPPSPALSQEVPPASCPSWADGVFHWGR